MASSWNRPWNNAAQKDRDLGQKTPYTQTRTSNLGKAQCKADGACSPTKGQFRESQRKVNQPALKHGDRWGAKS